MLKHVRAVLIVMAVPALTLLGLREIGGTAIFKGYDVGLKWHTYPGKVVINADPEGNMTCWVRLKIRGASASYLSTTSANQRLRVYEEQQVADGRWIAIVKDGQTPEEKFDWPTGGTITLSTQPPSPDVLYVMDWYVFPSNKGFDSQERSRWRGLGFRISVALLVLSLIGGTLEAVDKVREKREPFSPQICLQTLIRAVEGNTPDESKRMRNLLERVLIEGVSVRDALGHLRLESVKRWQFWFITRREFRSRLTYLIDELTRYLDRL